MALLNQFHGFMFKHKWKFNRKGEIVTTVCHPTFKVTSLGIMNV